LTRKQLLVRILPSNDVQLSLTQSSPFDGGLFSFLAIEFPAGLSGSAVVGGLLIDLFLAGGILMRRFYRIMRVVCWKYGRTMCRPQNPRHFYNDFHDAMF
jgi:hypothetical protein